VGIADYNNLGTS